MYFYELKVQYRTDHTDDQNSQVKETYIVQNNTFGDAELTIKTHLFRYVVKDQIEVLTMKRLKIYDLIKTYDAEKIFKCKVDLITIDERGKETSTRHVIYVGATSLEAARKEIDTYLIDISAKLVSVEETKVIEILRKQ